MGKTNVKTGNKGKSTPKGKGKGKSAPVILTHANGADFSPKRPGVIARIVSELLAHPVTKSGLLATLCDAFPEREPAHLKSTLAMQVPSGLYIEKGYIVTRKESEGGTLYSLSRAAQSAGDGWRVAKKTDPTLARPEKGE